MPVSVSESPAPSAASAQPSPDASQRRVPAVEFPRQPAHRVVSINVDSPRRERIGVRRRVPVPRWSKHAGRSRHGDQIVVEAAERKGERRWFYAERVGQHFQRPRQIAAELLRPTAKIGVRMGVRSQFDQPVSCHLAALSGGKRPPRRGRRRGRSRRHPSSNANGRPESK